MAQLACSDPPAGYGQWSLPVAVALTGADDPEMLQQKIDMVRRFKNVSEAHRKQLVAKVDKVTDQLRIEYYKA